MKTKMAALIPIAFSEKSIKPLRKISSVAIVLSNLNVYRFERFSCPNLERRATRLTSTNARHLLMAPSISNQAATKIFSFPQNSDRKSPNSTKILQTILYF